MREAREVEVGLIDVEEEDADEDEGKTYLTQLPRRCIKRCCPKVVQWLEAAGYDEALIIKDLVHMCLYLSCIVSFFFAAMSINEVVSFKCFEAERGNSADITEAGGIPECLIQAICGLIFFGNLRDSVVMLGSYDNDHQNLLNRKKELMAELKTDIESAYQKASQVADKLYTMLLKTVEDDVADMITNASALFENFNKILFEKQGSFGPEGVLRPEHQADVQLLQTLVAFVRRLLAEPGQISASFCTSLQQKNKIRLGEGRAFNSLKIAQQRVELFTDTLLLEEHLSHTKSSRADRDDMRKEVKQRPDRLAREIVEPVRIVSDYMMDLKNGANKIASGQATIVYSDRLIGFGRPPWADEPDEDSLFRCCMPRLFALILRRLCCLCFCGPTCFQEAFKYYPPKRVRFGFVWFQIVSKLHERQIQGLIFSILLATFYGAKVSHTIVHGCKGGITSGSFWACAGEEFKKSAMLLALLFHIPATFLCLLRIRNLDAVIRIMEDIRKLQGLRDIIRDFEKTLAADEKRQELLDKVTERVLARVKKFKKFWDSLRRPKQQKVHLDVLQRSSLRLHIEGVNHFFKYAEDILQPADKWLKVPKDQQDARINKVVQEGDRLSRNDWRIGGSENDPACTHFTPSNSWTSLPSVKNAGNDHNDHS